MSGLYLYWLKINNQERDCDGIFIKNAVLVVRAKSEKLLKMGNVWPLLWVLWGFGGDFEGVFEGGEGV